ncbi:MAG: hypothetical protein K2G96_03890, partial [Clostridia bacterium]|nr:hypothetical protein [Clostridia bacterium]
MKKQKQDAPLNEGQEEVAVTSAVADESVSVEGASAEGQAAAKNPNRLDTFFGITASGSTIKTEVIAGLTTFMAMVYALLVVPGMYGAKDSETGLTVYNFVSFNAVYIATALGAIVGTMMMAFLARMPLAQASGLGASAYVTGTLLGKIAGFTYANAMVFVLIDGLIFVLLTATG